MNDDELPARRIEFQGQELWARVGEDPARTFVAVRPICRHLGLSSQMQSRRIQDHPVLAARVFTFTLPSDGGNQATLCLRLDALNFWLATIQPHDVRRDPQTTALLVAYQRECADALYRHFFGASQAVPPDVMHTVPLLRCIDGKVDRLAGKVDQLLGHVELAALRASEDRERAEAFYWRFMALLAVVREMVGRLPRDHDPVIRRLDRIEATLGQIAIDTETIDGRVRMVTEEIAIHRSKRPRRPPTPGQQAGLDAFLRQRRFPFSA